MINQIKLLLANNYIFPSFNYIIVRLESHPDYPSFASIYDTLQEVGITCRVCQGTKEELEKENRPFLAHFNVNGGDIRYYHSMADAERQVNEFDKYWSGHVLFIEKPGKYGNREHDLQHKEEKLVRFFNALAFIIIATIYLCIAIYFTNSYFILFTISCFIGLYLSWLILQKEFGLQNTVSDKICGMAKHSQCQAVLFSKGAKLFSWLTWGDVGIVYFAGSLFFLSFSLLIGQHTVLFCYISLGGLIFPVYSLYYQWRVIKQWCMLCLGVLIALAVNGTIGIIQISKSSGFFLNKKQLGAGALLFITILLFVLAAWYVVKSLYQRSLSSFANQIKAEKFRRNPQIFNALLDKQDYNWLNLPEQKESIRFGNLLAPWQIVVACNPFCIPCAKAHQALEGLFEKFPDRLCIAIRFALDKNDDKDRKVTAAREIIRAAKQQSFEAVRDWYQLLSIEKFKEKHPSENIDVNDAINEHIAWSKLAGINATPTVFINGKQLPEIYSWNELIEHITYRIHEMI